MTRFNLMGFAVMVAVVAACAHTKSHQKVAHGERAVGRASASTVVLTSPAFDRLCSGTIIGERHVVTAAHCMVPEPMTIVGFGSSFESSRKVAVDRWWIHPSYRDYDNHERFYYDIAVVTLAKPITDIPGPWEIAPIFRRSVRDIFAESFDQTLTLAGFGRQEDESIGDLMMVNIPINVREVQNTISGQFGPRQDPEPVEVEVRSRNFKGACKGDSGGSVYLQSTGEWLGIIVGGGQRVGGGCKSSMSTIFVNGPAYHELLAEAFESLGAPLTALTEEPGTVDDPGVPPTDEPPVGPVADLPTLEDSFVALRDEHVLFSTKLFGAFELCVPVDGTGVPSLGDCEFVKLERVRADEGRMIYRTARPISFEEKTYMVVMKDSEGKIKGTLKFRLEPND